MGLCNLTEARKVLGVSLRTLRRWVNREHDPCPSQPGVGRDVLVDIDSVREWAALNRKTLPGCPVDAPPPPKPKRKVQTADERNALRKARRMVAKADAKRPKAKRKKDRPPPPEVDKAPIKLLAGGAPSAADVAKEVKAKLGAKIAKARTKEELIAMVSRGVLESLAMGVELHLDYLRRVKQPPTPAHLRALSETYKVVEGHGSRDLNAHDELAGKSIAELAEDVLEQQREAFGA